MIDYKKIIEDIDFFFYCQISNLKDIKYFILNYFEGDHNLNTGIKRGSYSDKTYKVQEALFLAVEDFIARDKEDAFSRVNFDWTEDHKNIKNKIIEVLYFYRIKLPELEKESERLMDIMYSGVSLEDIIARPRIKYKEEFDMLQEVDAHINEETQRHLHMVVDIRPYLWS